MEFRHPHIHRADEKGQLAAELGVEKAYSLDEPLWYLRLTACFRLDCRRELATVATVFGLGIALGFLVGRLQPDAPGCCKRPVVSCRRSPTEVTVIRGAW